MDEHRVLFLPGPTEVGSELREIMARPLIGHRDPAFVAAAQDVCSRLAALYCTTQNAAFETGPATALMEAAIRNFAPRGARTLHLTGGAFGRRWQTIARACGRDAEALEVPAGQAHDPVALRARLATGPEVATVCITHNETSTGVLQPLAALAAVVRECQPDALILVDAVTSVGGAELRFDAFRLDFAFAGTQKCLALPPGLCTYAVSHRALDRAEPIEERGYLLDFVRAVKNTTAGKPIATPCIPLVFALQRQLERVAEETLETRWARHRELREITLQWAETAGFAPFVPDVASRSPTISCLDANGACVQALVRRAAAAGFTLGAGYGDLAGRTFRIGHLGDHRTEGLRALLGAIG